MTNDDDVIAIIGAGFGGLAFANFCEKHGLAYRLFESNSRNPEFHGTIDLPSWPLVAKELGLKGTHELVTLSRDVALAELRRNVILEYSTHVIQVMRENSHKVSLLDKSGNQYGPFALVVAADGVLSPFRKMPGGRVALVGDARWVADTWDFGYSRICQGADVALRDAMELGTFLLQPSSYDDLGKFCAKRKRKEVVRRRLAAFVALPILIAIWFQGAPQS